MANSTLASQLRSVSQVVAPSAMLPMASMPPRIARQHASLDGASRDAWTAAPLQSPRPHWTVALASHLPVPILALSLQTLALAVLTSNPHCPMGQLWVPPAPSVV